MKEITIRPVLEEEILRLWELSAKETSPEWKKWDAPFIPHEPKTLEQFLEKKDQYINQEDFWGIYVDESLVGSLCYYWEHEASLWLEVGIIIYEPAFWNGGIGTAAIRMWITHLFNDLPLVRIGYTTWSGNDRMIKVGEKLGMTMEARLRKCCFYNGLYYDSIRMGILREEWEERV
ncbi:GNAT family N-acetyltransferase [Psychrobacillus sp. L4]|uniref:GNAT family N-acetyltransferase n=1 Tax=Psychrobacillus sp. L4 TaxID=3236892 RepID=UPI0036F1F136